jgi:hypothetical protein
MSYQIRRAYQMICTRVITQELDNGFYDIWYRTVVLKFVSKFQFLVKIG